MHVNLYQSLGPADLIRPARHGSVFPFNAPHRQYFYRARNAIYYLFRALRSRRDPLVVLAPEYHSGNEVLAMQAAGATVHYCPIGPDLCLDPADVERLCDRYRPDVLYVIHYAGWPQPMPAFVELCRRRGIWLVEDCALSLLSALDHRPLGSFGDWSVFCLYKTLPVPNGAVLVHNGVPLEDVTRVSLRPPTTASVAGRIAELTVARIRARSGPAGRALAGAKRMMGRTASALHVRRANVGDIGFEIDDVDLAMSGVSARVIERLDFVEIRARRAANYRRLVDRLEGAAPLFSDVPDGVCPLFCPVLVPDKPRAARLLWDRGIEALQFWNEGVAIDGYEPSTTEQFLRTHVLELPIHQDLSNRQIDYIARHVAAINPWMPHAVHTPYAA
jgi:hypothetical protein